MTNLRNRLLEEVEKFGEPLEAIVVGQHDSRLFKEPALPDENVQLDVARGLAKLDYDYDPGFGPVECHPLYAWTASRVFFLAEYDGSTSLTWVPRHPIDIAPEFTGQG